jgi:hypothetical protein
MRFCCKNAGLHVQHGRHGCKCDDCETNWAGIGSYVDALFAAGTNSKMQTCLRETVSAVFFSRDMVLEFHVKDGKGKWWMMAR